MRKILKKKGVSPIIATVLLVALAIALAAGVFMWAKGFIGKSSGEGKEIISESCDSVAFEVDKYLDGTGANKLDIINQGNFNISIILKDIKIIIAQYIAMRIFAWAFFQNRATMAIIAAQETNRSAMDISMALLL